VSFDDSRKDPAFVLLSAHEAQRAVSVQDATEEGRVFNGCLSNDIRGALGRHHWEMTAEVRSLSELDSWSPDVLRVNQCCAGFELARGLVCGLPSELTVVLSPAAMKKLTEVLADWGLTSRRSSSEYS
jgi:hypothetical protein